jgi:hypothetical protein
LVNEKVIYQETHLPAIYQPFTSHLPAIYQDETVAIQGFTGIMGIFTCIEQK